MGFTDDLGMAHLFVIFTLSGTFLKSFQLLLLPNIRGADHRITHPGANPGYFPAVL